MIAELKEICDRIVMLLQYRQEQRRDLFDSTIEPIFDQLAKIHEDYTRGTLELLKLIESHADNPDAIRTQLEEKQQQLWHIRRLTAEMVRPFLKQIKFPLPHDHEPRNYPEATYMFASSVFWYFFPTAGAETRDATPTNFDDPLRRFVDGTHFTLLTQVIDKLLVGGISSNETRDYVRRSRDRLNRRWIEMSDAFSKLRSICYGYATKG